MANDGSLNFSGMQMRVSKTELINALLPTLINALAQNPVLLSQLTKAVTTAQLTKARTTGNVLGRAAGGNQSGAATKINGPSGISR